MAIEGIYRQSPTNPRVLLPASPSDKSSQITPFNFGTHAVRVVMREGQPWFVATDVARVLGYRDAHNAAKHLDADERGVLQIGVPLSKNEKGSAITRTPGGDQSVTIINESGMYALVLRSRKPEARKFAKWVTGEVLPSIRKTGGYGAAPAIPVIDSERVKFAQSLAAQAVVHVYRTVFEAVMAGRDWVGDRWLLSCDYHHGVGDRPSLPRVKTLAGDAFVLSETGFIKAIASGDILRGNEQLAETITACVQRLTRQSAPLSAPCNQLSRAAQVKKI